jgi:hypothetical protein
VKKIQNLTQKLRALLEDRAAVETSTEVAEHYAQLCRQAEARLEGVVAMLDKGNDYQALQSAEQEPALLDFIADLSFGSELDWQHYCERNGISVAPRLDAKGVQRVMALYKNPITAKHPLYKDFRSAMLERDDDKALHTVRTILKLNPGDEPARRELKRLENKRFQVAVDRLKELLQSGKNEGLADLVEELERMADPEKLARVDVYERAKLASRELQNQSAQDQLPVLVERMEKQREQEDWRGVGMGLETWRQLCQNAGGQVNVGTRQNQIDQLESYFRKQQASHQAQHSFETALKSFMLFVEELETRLLTSAGYSHEEIREKDEVFVRRWKELESYNKPVPSDLLQRIKSAGTGLRGRLESMQKVRQVKFGSMVVAAVAALLAVSAVGWHAWKAYQLSTNLDEYRKLAQCEPAEKLIAAIRTGEPMLLRWPYLQSRVEEIASWTRQARGAEEQAKRDLEALQREVESKPQIDKAEALQALLVQAEKSVKTVSKDISPPLTTRLDEWRVKVELHMGTLLEQRIQKTLAELNVLDAECEQALSFEKPASSVAAFLKSFETRLRSLEQLTKINVPGLQLPEDLNLRINAVGKKAADYQKELDALASAKKSLQEADTYDNYLKALRAWQVLRFAEAAPAIKRIDSLPSEKSFLAQIVTSGDEAVLKAVEEDTSGSAMFPNAPTDSDLKHLIELQDDGNLNDVYEHQVVDYSKGERKRTLWSQGPLQSSVVGSAVVWRGKIYDPDNSSNSVYFTSTELYPRLVGGSQLGMEVVRSSSKLSLTSELMNSLRLKNMTDSDGKYFRMAVLDLLDQLARNESASPLAKAYVMLELEELAKPRKYAWGLYLCPSLEADLSELRRLLGKTYLSSEDWMAKNMLVSTAPKLADFFRTIKGRSYLKEAQARRDLLLPVIRAGLKFGGHVDTDLNIKLTQAARTSSDLWYLRQDNTPGLLQNPGAEAASPNAQPLKAANAQVLSPVFFMPVDRKALIEKYQATLTPVEKSQPAQARESYFLAPP